MLHFLIHLGPFYVLLVACLIEKLITYSVTCIEHPCECYCRLEVVFIANVSSENAASIFRLKCVWRKAGDLY